MFLLVPVILHEHEVADFNVTAAVTWKRAVRVSELADAWSKIVVDFRARPTGTGLCHLPKIIRFIQSDNAVSPHSCFFRPDLFGFVIFAKDGVSQTVWRQIELFGQKLPVVCDGLFLEIVAKREIAKHFEERSMSSRVADFIEVIVFTASAHEFLAACRSGVWTLFSSSNRSLN